MEILSRSDALKIINNFIHERLNTQKWYRDIYPYIEAIVFYGSTAKGKNRVDSDIDILIFVPLEIEEKFTKGEYVYSYNDREINIVLRSIEGLERIAQGPHDPFQSEVFREAQIIFEKSNSVRNLIDIICK